MIYKFVFLSSLVLSSLVSVTTFAASSTDTHPLDESDPFARMEHFVLPNGLDVVLAPSEAATLTAIRLEVGTGFQAENPSTYGVSHLLEHTLFRNKVLKDEMSYVQLVEAEGGEINGVTARRSTSYGGSILAAKGVWLLDTIFKIVLVPNIDATYVEKEKATVEMEIGRPGPFVEKLGFDPMTYIYPKYLNPPSFWEREFGWKEKTATTLEEQFSNRRLTLEQIVTHYKNYYYPSNMTLFVAGKFNREQVLRQIKKTYGRIAKRDGLRLPEDPPLVSRRRPYYQVFSTVDNPSFSIGIKVDKATFVDEEVLESYFKYTEQRLMKELRNRHGEIYSATPSFNIFKGYGYALLTIKTSKESFLKNLERVRSYFYQETQVGALSPEQIKEAVALSLSDYSLRGRESGAMMRFAQFYNFIHIGQKGPASPYRVLKNISPESYNASLKKMFRKDMNYEVIWRPNVFFPYDNLVCLALIGLVFFFVSRRYLTKKFFNDRVHWIRNVQFPPLKVLEVLAFGLTWYAAIHIKGLFDILFFGMADIFPWLARQLFIVNFLKGGLEAIAYFMAGQLIFSLIPRKLIVMDKILVIKSLSYFSNHIPLAEISGVRVLRPLSLPVPWRLWFKKVRWRSYFLSLQIWKKGLLIERIDGRCYFFSVRDADAAQVELAHILNEYTKISDGSPAGPYINEFNVVCS
jgi:zinc protease